MAFRPQRLFLHIEPRGLFHEINSIFPLDSLDLLEMQFLQ